MLSYLHQFHAGNEGDLLKHTCLVYILENLIKKDKPFTIIDTHSSCGIFDLNSDEAQKTNESKDGIVKLMNFYKKSSMTFTEGIKKYLTLEEPYFNRGLYAGSAELERLYLRDGDKLNLVDLHPQTLKELRQNITKPLKTQNGEKKCSGSITVHEKDSYKALISLTPPLIKRGLILIDPSYEDASDYKMVTETIIAARKKWSTAIIALWYPLLERRKFETAQMLSFLEDDCKTGKTAEFMNAEFKFMEKEDIPKESKSHLYGSGMFVINPCWHLEENLLKDIEFYKKILTLI